MLTKDELQNEFMASGFEKDERKILLGAMKLIEQKDRYPEKYEKVFDLLEEFKVLDE